MNLSKASVVILTAGVVAVALAIRLAVLAFVPAVQLSEDSVYYEGQARQLREGGMEVYFPNGYPAMVALVPGELGSAEHRTRVLRMNALLSALTCGCVALAVLRLGAGSRVALGAGLVCAAWPNQVNYARHLMSDPLACFLFTAALAGLASEKRPVAGFFWGAACVTRTSLLPGAWCLGVVWLWRRQWGRLLAVGVGMAVPVGSFLLLAGLRTGHCALDGAFYHNVVHAIATTGEPMRYYEPHAFYFAPHGEILRAYFNGLLQDPLHFLHQRLAALWAMWGPWPGAGNYGRGVVFQLLIGLRFPLLVAGVAGFLRGPRNDTATAAFATVVLLTALHTALYATSRHSLPVEPALMILAATGWAASRRRIPA